MQINIANYRFRLHISLKKIVEVEGVNSNLLDSNHILMWDFDNVNLNIVMTSLRSIQDKWKLPTVYIIETNKDHYHAYCFQSLSRSNVAHILLDTPFICNTYVNLGIIRGYWTLRISPEKGDFKLVAQLLSDIPEYNNGIDMLPITKYRTAK